jgi:biopolymer transport protein ExbB/TolQ
LGRWFKEIGEFMGTIIWIVFQLLAVTGIIVWAVKSWKKASITEKLDKAQELEQDFKTVKEFERNHKDLSGKSKKVKQFKNQDF